MAVFRATLLAGLMTFALTTQLHGSSEPRLPTLSTEPLAVHVVLGQPVMVEVEVTNETGNRWIVDWGGFRSGNISLTVNGPGGLTEDESVLRDYSLDGGVTVGGPVPVEPGEEARQTVVLSSWLDFQEVGEYLVTVHVPVEKQASGVRASIEGVVPIEVAPAEPRALLGACSELADRAVKPPSEAAHLAGEALSHVRDDICIPALARVLEESFFAKNEAVLGLVGIGSEDAFAALAAQWTSLDEGVKARANYELSVRGQRDAFAAALAAVGIVDNDRL